MKPLDWPLLADENIHPDVISALAATGKDVRSIRDRGVGFDDREILRLAHAERRVVLTHDADFGTLAVRDGEPFTGIVYLRPGHIVATFVIEIIDAIEAVALDVADRHARVPELRHGGTKDVNDVEARHPVVRWSCHRALDGLPQSDPGCSEGPRCFERNGGEKHESQHKRRGCQLPRDAKLRV